MLPTQNLRVEQVVRLATPRALKAQLPCTEAVNQTVVSSRRAVERILRREDPRLLVVARPVLDTRSEGGVGLRAAAGGPENRTGGHDGNRHAGVFREAADDDWLEGADQRSAPGREQRHRVWPEDGRGSCC